MITFSLSRDQFPDIMPDFNDYMTTQEAAKVLDFHVVTIRKMVLSGKLESLKVGVALMISRESVRQYKKLATGMSKHDPRRRKRQKAE